MKILVCVKRVLDHNIKARAKADGSGVNLDNVKMSMNPFDEIAVEEAVRLKEAGNAAEIIILSIGTSLCTETIRSALALGGDRGILVETLDEIQPLTAARIIAQIAQKEAIQLVIMGKQSIDDDCNQTGQMVAGLLDWPQGAFISKCSLSGNQVYISREVDGGLEEMELALPAVLTVDLRLNTPRYPTLPNIMKAKQKPLSVIKLAETVITPHLNQITLKVSEPPVRKGGRKVKDVTELLQCLQQEAKVI